MEVCTGALGVYVKRGLIELMWSPPVPCPAYAIVAASKNGSSETPTNKAAQISLLTRGLCYADSPIRILFGGRGRFRQTCWVGPFYASS